MSNLMSDLFPRKIVCLTEETTEMLYLLGEEDRIAGISGYTVRPPRARREKPRISAFTSAKIDRIIELDPDLVLGFSDLQADIAADLVRAGLNVHIFNQRTVPEIFTMIATLGALVGCPEKALAWIGERQQHIALLKAQNEQNRQRPRVYFEEWYDPIITGIGWVSELIEIAGGEDCYAELADCKLAKDRIIADPLEVASRKPDIIIGSWCGRRFLPEKVAERPGWENVPAVQNGDIFEIRSSDILQPGPAALTDGLEQIGKIISDWQEKQEGRTS